MVTFRPNYLNLYGHSNLIILFTDSQILAVLKQAETGTPVPELCREHNISSATFYKWREQLIGSATEDLSHTCFYTLFLHEGEDMKYWPCVKQNIDHNSYYISY